MLTVQQQEPDEYPMHTVQGMDIASVVKKQALQSDDCSLIDCTKIGTTDVLMLHNGFFGLLLT